MKIIGHTPTCDYHMVNGLYVLDENVWLDFELNGVKFRITVDKGAMTDGLSVPRIFRWYLPCWDDNNPGYNIAGIVHDGCYGSEILCKEMADELFYKGLLFSHIKLSKAAVADWAVEHLAGLHYGFKHDDFNISPYVSLTCI